MDSTGKINIKYKVDNPPAYIIKLVSLYKQASKVILDKYTKDDKIKRSC